jgi:hypothetical protein
MVELSWDLDDDVDYRRGKANTTICILKPWPNTRSIVPLCDPSIDPSYSCASFDEASDQFFGMHISLGQSFSMQQQQQYPIRSWYLLALSLLMTSYICSVITTTRILHGESTTNRHLISIPLVLNDGRGAAKKSQRQPSTAGEVQGEEAWPPQAFFQQHVHASSTRIVVAIVNYDYVDFADNFAQSLLRQNVSNFCLVPMDDPTYGTQNENAC